MVSVRAPEGLAEDLAEQIGVLMASGSYVIPMEARNLKESGQLGFDASLEFDRVKRADLLDEYYVKEHWDEN